MTSAHTAARQDRTTSARGARRVAGRRWFVGALCAALPVLVTPHELADPSALFQHLREEAAAYEYGAGVPQDSPRAVTLYCEAARLGDAISQFELGWMYANGRGVGRDDGLAAFFFKAAADRGIEQARTMLHQVGDPVAETPECMREPAAPTASVPPPPAAENEAKDRLSPAPRNLVRLVMKLAPQYDVSPVLALAIMRAESNFDARAVSMKNAQGLMQLVPDTAARFGVKNAFDPVDNIRGGLAYLRWLLGYFRGDLALVAAAYNAGEGAVQRYRGVPPYDETRDYVQRIVKAVRSEAALPEREVSPGLRPARVSGARK